MKPNKLVLIPVFVLISSNGTTSPERTVQDLRETIVGLPCEGCEAVFQGMPESIGSDSRIASKNEPGDPMVIEGVVRDLAGDTVSGVIVYAYQTNADGIYPTDEKLEGTAAHRHGRLRAWAKSDENGRYSFKTIRPGAYPGTELPAHIHMHVIEVGRCTYYIDDIMFEDDPFLTAGARERLTDGRGGSGAEKPEWSPTDGWIVQRDVVLGERIPGYADCGS